MLSLSTSILTLISNRVCILRLRSVGYQVVPIYSILSLFLFHPTMTVSHLILLSVLLNKTSYSIIIILFLPHRLTSYSLSLSLSYMLQTRSITLSLSLWFNSFMVFFSAEERKYKINTRDGNLV